MRANPGGAEALKAWASPFRGDHFGGGRARSDEAVCPLVSSLYKRFGVTGISQGFVTSELEGRLANKSGNDGRR